MISLDQYNDFCASLPGASHVVQWRGTHVWKVGGKVFALAVPTDGGSPMITFKCTPMSYEMLRAEPGLRPAPYLASRGFSWIQMYEEPGLESEDLKSFIESSYRHVVAGLTKRVRRELGLCE